MRDNRLSDLIKACRDRKPSGLVQTRNLELSKPASLPASPLATNLDLPLCVNRDSTYSTYSTLRGLCYAAPTSSVNLLVSSQGVAVWMRIARPAALLNTATSPYPFLLSIIHQSQRFIYYRSMEMRSSFPTMIEDPEVYYMSYNCLSGSTAKSPAFMNRVAECKRSANSSRIL